MSGSTVRDAVTSVPSQTTNITGLRIAPRIEFLERIDQRLPEAVEIRRCAERRAL